MDTAETVALTKKPPEMMPMVQTTFERLRGAAHQMYRSTSAETGTDNKIPVIWKLMDDRLDTIIDANM